MSEVIAIILAPEEQQAGTRHTITLAADSSWADGLMHIQPPVTLDTVLEYAGTDGDIEFDHLDSSGSASLFAFADMQARSIEGRAPEDCKDRVVRAAGVIASYLAKTEDVNLVIDEYETLAKNKD